MGHGISHQAYGHAGKNAVCLIIPCSCRKISADVLTVKRTVILYKYRTDKLPVVDADNKPVGMIDVQDIVARKVVG